MNLLTPIGTSSAPEDRRWLGTRNSAGWPAIMGFLAAIVSVLMLVAASFVYSEARRQTALSEQLKDQTAHLKIDRSPSTIESRKSQLPLESASLNDVSLVLRLAKEQGVGFTSVTYRSEPFEKIPIVIKSMEVRMVDEYPRLKVFIARLLGDIPHLYLDEIRIEQTSVQTNKIQATLKLSFAYQRASVLDVVAGSRSQAITRALP